MSSLPKGIRRRFMAHSIPWVQGVIFRWVGPNNMSGRLLTLVAALATVTLLTVTIRGDHSVWYLVVAWIMILGVNQRAGLYFAENRPDMMALFFVTMAVLLMGYGQEKRRGLLVVLGSALMVVGFFFKQTAFVFSVVPLVALVLRWRRPIRSEIILATVPMVIAVGVVFAIKVTSPTVYYYMFVTHSTGLAVEWPRVAKAGWEFLINSPIFLVLVGEWIVSGEWPLRKSPRVLWLMSVLAVTIPYGALTSTKDGGWCNSLLPALLPMAAFCALRFPVLLRRLDDSAAHLQARLAFGSFVAVLMLMTTFPHVTKYTIEPASSRDAGYDEIISLAARLPGTVICPEEPTIPLYAKGHTGLSVYAELDTRLVHGIWPTTIPDPVVTEIRGADYVVNVTVTNGWEDPIRNEHLLDLGFEPTDDPAFNPGGYRLWRRKGSSSETISSRTVLNLP